MEILIGYSILFAFFGLAAIAKSKVKKRANQTLTKFSDADVFKLVHHFKYFISAQQLSENSPLNLQESKDRLNYLANQGILTRYSNSNGMRIYQMTEALPQYDALPLSIRGLTGQQIIDTLLQYSPDYEITIPELVVVYGLSVQQAKELQKDLVKQKLLFRYRKGKHKIYIVDVKLHEKYPSVQLSHNPYNTTLPSSNNDGKLKIPDADVLQLAIENKGQLSPENLCLKLNIPLSEAKIKLDDLYNEGVFVLDADEDDALLRYSLRDKSLL